MQPRRIGPYLIVGSVGSGGMGVVWEGKHEVTGVRVALKTTRVADAALGQAIEREIWALRALAHPGLVSVVDHGTTGDRPWFAMELVQGRPLSEFVRPSARGTPVAADTMMLDVTTHRNDDASDDVGPAVELDPARLALIRKVGREVCEALAYLHGEGVAHRDVKPDNILLTDRGSVLVDLGLATRFSDQQGRDRLGALGEHAGTPHYMAPEVIRREAADARADLYAVGCVLYELLCGRPPFVGPDEQNILGQHLVAEPVPVSERVAGVPPALDDLVSRLLSKDPAARPPYAETVAATLDPSTPPPTPRPWLHPPGLAGRRLERDALNGALDRLALGHGGVLVLAGESGIGKTRLAKGLVAQARRRGVRLLVGEGQVHRPALGLFRRPLVALDAESTLDIDPSVTPSAARVRQVTAIVEALRGAARQRPLLLLLDDLQWADERSLDVLGSLCDRAHDTPLLVVGTSRIEEEPQRLSSLPGADRVMLRPLNVESTAALATSMLACEDLGESFVEWLHTRSHGNPGFAVQVLRAALEAGAFERAPGGGWRPALDRPWHTPLPDTLPALIQGRIDGLPAAARRVLAVAAVGGRTVGVADVAAVAGLPVEPVQDAFSDAIRRQLLEDGPGGLRFAHDKVHEIAVAAADDLAATHAAWATMLESREVVDSAQVGLHWLSAGDPGRAVQHLGRAAKQASSRYAHLEAIDALRLALSACTGPPSEIEARTYQSLGLALKTTFRYSEAEHAYRRSVEVGEAAGLLAVAGFGHAYIASLCADAGRADEAMESLRIARDRIHRAGDDVAFVAFALAAGPVEMVLGHVDAAVEVLERAQQIAVRLDLGDSIGMVHNNLAMAYDVSGRTQDAKASYRRAVASHRAARNALSLGRSLNNLAGTELGLGSLAEARTFFVEALALNQRCANPMSEAVSLSGLARLEAVFGDPIEAVDLARRALVLARAASNRTREVFALTPLGEVLLRTGHAAEAHSAWTAALGGAVGAGVPGTVAGRQVDLARAAVAIGRVDEARALVEGVVGPPGLGLCLARGALALTQDPEQALRELERFEPDGGMGTIDVYVARARIRHALGSPMTRSAFLEAIRPTEAPVTGWLAEQVQAFTVL